MKKYLDYILLGAATLFSGLNFAFMALPACALRSGNFVLESDSLYGCMGDSGLIVVAFILILLAFLIALCLCTLTLLKGLKVTKFELPYANIIALGGAVLALVAAIMYFVVPSSFDASMAAGSLLCGLFSLFAACSLGAFVALKLVK